MALDNWHVENMIPRRILLIISGTVSAVVLLWDSIGNYRLCGADSWGGCVDTLASVEILLFPILSLFVATVLISWVRAQVYASWFRFARWWVPLSMLLIAVAPPHSGNILDPVEKGSVALVSSVLFLVISLGIIIVSAFRARRGERKS